MAAEGNHDHQGKKDKTDRRIDLTLVKDVAYATRSEAQKLDIYLPSRVDGPRPVILWIHPGGFHCGDKGGNASSPGAKFSILELALPMLERGYSVVSTNYRLSGEAVFPAAVHDVKAAVRWIRTRASRYGFAPDKIVAWGSSAGGYLATMLATTGGADALEDLSLGNADQSSRIAAAVDWYGPVDFLLMDEHHTELGREAHVHEAGSPESRFMGAPIYEIRERCKAATPMTYIGKDSAPLYIQQGKGDVIIPYPQSMMLAEKLAAAIGAERVVLDLVEMVGHADWGFFKPENIHKIIDFLDRYIR
jgi:acetyl esterase/lipase